jgi:hypothetical protein
MMAQRPLADRRTRRIAVAQAFAWRPVPEGAMKWLVPLFLLGVMSMPAAAYDLSKAAATFKESYTSEPTSLRVLGGWQGKDSQVSEFSLERVSDAAAWAALWKRHAPDVAPPPVDFGQAMVIAIFGGAADSTVGQISLDRVSEGQRIELVTMSFINDVIDRKTNNLYLFVALPRSRKEIRIVARTFMLMGNPQTDERVVGTIAAIDDR